MSDTPRTDAQWMAIEYGDDVPADFARQLERELTVARNKAAELFLQHRELQSELAAERIKREATERRLEALRAAAADVVQRWDSPMWRHETHTGVYIEALRTATPPPLQP